MDNVTMPASQAVAPFEVLGLDGNIATAYAAMLLMAMLPIYVGAWRSLKHRHKEEEDEEPERMTMKDAAMFPVFASCALFGLYLLFKYFGKEYINLLLGGYFFLIGLWALTQNLRPIFSPFYPKSLLGRSHTLALTRDLTPAGAASHDEAEHHQELLYKLRFDRLDIVCLIAAAGLGVWYLMTKHWIANNLFGLAFAVNGVEMIQLEKFGIGAIMLCGLFIYDIFWVFGTEVMVTVAKSFDAPIKVVFPRDFWNNPLFSKEHSMLGLGDIVIPGIFIALLLRFDDSLKSRSSFYFHATFVAYFVGLVTTMAVMHIFKAAQPALLYLVPACLLTPLLLSSCRGHIAALFAYEDNPKKESEGTAEEEKRRTSAAKKPKEAKKTK